MRKEYDLIIIGAGPGGYVAAIRAAQEGLKTALIEKQSVGGTCLNRGCIPTKALIHATGLYQQMRTGGEWGIDAQQISYDIERIYRRKDEIVEKVVGGVEFLLNTNKIELIRGSAQLDAAKVVTVQTAAGPQELTAPHIIIATGSVPAKPAIEGLDLPGVMTSNELLEQKGIDYRSLTIIGAGVIGVEFATVFSALGCKVTLIEAMSRVLPTMDRDIGQNLSMLLKRRGVDIHTGASVERVVRAEDGLACQFTSKERQMSVQAEAVLVAIGRRAELSGLLVDDKPFQMERGLVVDENCATSVPGIYAIGDVVSGNIQLAHVASAQASNVIARIVGKKPALDLRVVPSCIYTDPEIASVGLTVDQAKAEGIAVKVGKFNMAGNAKSVIEAQDRGFIKLVFAAETQQILGAQLMCARATDLVSELATAIVNKLTVEQLSAVIRPHPTFCEGVTEALEDVNGRAIHIAPKAR